MYTLPLGASTMLSSWYSPGAPTLVSFCVRGSYFQMIAGAGPYVPPQVRDALAFRIAKPEKELPKAMLGVIDQSREAFDRAGGAILCL